MKKKKKRRRRSRRRRKKKKKKKKSDQYNEILNFSIKKAENGCVVATCAEAIVTLTVATGFDPSYAYSCHRVRS